MTAGADQTAVATIVYPADWFTVATPPNLACRYFDPAEITVPADPTTLTTAVMIKTDPLGTYTDALAAATDPANWTVATNEAVTVSGLPATRIEGDVDFGRVGLSGRDHPVHLPDRRGRPPGVDRDLRHRDRSDVRR